MAPTDPGSPDEPLPDDTPEPESRSSDYFNDPAATEQAWQEIVAELLNLSTDQPNGETARTDTGQVELDFPRAPWVDNSHWSGEPPAPDLPTRSPSDSSPRDWADSQEALDEIDAFAQPDPQFEMSADPGRNLGWFLTIFSLLGLLLTVVFTHTAHRFTLLILGTLFLCGAGLLVWRMPTKRDPHDHDGGAQV